MEDTYITKVWEDTGMLWKNLRIYETVNGYVGVLSDSDYPYASDRTIAFGVAPSIEDAITEIISYDTEAHSDLTMFGEEG